MNPSKTLKNLAAYFGLTSATDTRKNLDALKAIQADDSYQLPPSEVVAG